MPDSWAEVPGKRDSDCRCTAGSSVLINQVLGCRGRMDRNHSLCFQSESDRRSGKKITRGEKEEGSRPKEDSKELQI